MRFIEANNLENRIGTQGRVEVFVRPTLNDNKHYNTYIIGTKTFDKRQAILALPQQSGRDYLALTAHQYPSRKA